MDVFKKKGERVKNKIEDMRRRKVKWYKDQGLGVHLDIYCFSNKEKNFLNFFFHKIILKF
ncbi:MAG TPA: hypothetical protein PLE45_11635 [Spirochaetota bacterium]|nr:hypothetical protein [Spirochaetota bacterium]HOL57980.1 hypothetical protein [Spirochaetota bacterium]HPP05333.1 hypothetical protein [Spirochaetota bacterium]